MGELEAAKIKRFIGAALIGLVALAGTVVVLYHTRSDTAMTTDSAAYIQGAINLREGRGYGRFSGENIVVPITSFPPLFSVALAGFSLIGLDIPETGRVLNALLFGASIILGGLLIYQYTKSILSALVGCLLVLASKDLIVVHSYLLSDSLFTFLLLSSLYALIRYFHTTHRFALVVTGFLVGLLTLTRYAGLSLVIVFSLAIAVFRRASWKSRLVDIALLGGVSLLPMALWSYRNLVLTGTSTNRVIGFYEPSKELFVWYIDVWMNWLLPFRTGIPWGPRVVLVFSMMAFVSIAFILYEFTNGFHRSHYHQPPNAVLPWVLLLLIPMYQLFLIAYTMLLDAGAGVAAARRYLAPVLIPVIVLATCMLYRLAWENPGSRWLKSISLVYTLVLLVFYAQVSIRFVQNPGFAYGLTDARRYWTDVVNGLKRLDPSRPLISNDPQLLYILSNRTAYMTPIGYSRYTQEVNEEFTKDVAEMRRRMDEGAILVIFKADPNSDVNRKGQGEAIYMAEITKGLKKIADYSHARIFISPEGKT